MKVLVLALFVFSLVENRAEIMQTTTFANQPETTTKHPVCESYTPCGWDVYNKLTREIKHRLQNKCVCPSNTKCYRIEDDLAMATYIYRCRVKDPRETGDYISR